MADSSAALRWHWTSFLTTYLIVFVSVCQERDEDQNLSWIHDGLEYNRILCRLTLIVSLQNIVLYIAWQWGCGCVLLTDSLLLVTRHTRLSFSDLRLLPWKYFAIFLDVETSSLDIATTNNENSLWTLK